MSFSVTQHEITVLLGLQKLGDSSSINSNVYIKIIYILLSSLALQPFEGQGLPADCWLSFHLSTCKAER